MAGSNIDRTKQTNETDRLITMLETKVGTLDTTVAELEVTSTDYLDNINQGLTTTDSPTFAGLTVTGAMANAYRAITALRTLDSTDYTVDCTANSFAVTLPTAVGIQGRIYNIKNTGTGTITVNTTSSQTIDGETSQTLNQGDSMLVQSTNSNWIII